MEILLGALAEAIVSLVIEDVAQRPRLAALREKLRGDSPEKLALQHALAQSYRAFALQYPQMAHALFDEHFLRQPAVATELAKLLTPDRTPDRAALTQHWQAQFHTQPAQELTTELDFFLTSLTSAIKSHPTLKPFTDSRAFEQLYLIAQRSDEQVREQRTTNAHLSDIQRLLAEVAAMLTEKVTRLHIASAAGTVLHGDASAGQDVVLRDKIVNIFGPVPQQPSVPEAQPGVHPPTKLTNPFNDRGRINDASRFFGRQQLVRELQQALAAGNSIALIGPPESGKSSLLKYLQQTRDTWLASHEVIYLDLRGVIDEVNFCEDILQELTPLQSGKLRTVKAALSALKRALQERHVLLMLDAVEQLAEREFTTRLQELLGALMQSPNLLLLVASVYSLDKVFPSRDITSPWHRVFRPANLNYFTQAEMQDFLRQRLAACPIQFAEDEVNALWQNTQGHPGQVQRAAETLFDHKVAGH